MGGDTVGLLMGLRCLSILLPNPIHPGASCQALWTSDTRTCLCLKYWNPDSSPQTQRRKDFFFKIFLWLNFQFSFAKPTLFLYLNFHHEKKHRIFIFAVSWVYFILFCHMACGILVPQPRIKPGPTVMKVESLYRWTTREFPAVQFLCLMKRCCFYFLL